MATQACDGKNTSFAKWERSGKVNNEFKVYTQNGTLLQSFSLQEWFNKLAEVPVGEVYLNSIDRDGTGQGYQKELIEYILSAC